MSLRSKIVLTLTVIAVVYVTVDVFLMHTMVAAPFEALEEREAIKDVHRVQAGVEAATEDLATRARSLAHRNDAFRYLHGENPAYEADVLGPKALESLDVNLLYYCDAEGNVVWGRIEETETRAPIAVREFPGRSIGNRHPVMLTAEDTGSTAGLMITEHGPMLVSGQRIPDLAGEGSSPGCVILGRFYDDTLRAALGERVKVEVDIWPLEDEKLPERERELKDQITASPLPVSDVADDGTLNVYAKLHNLVGAPTLLMRAKFDRDITASGFRIFNFALLSTVATALVILFVLMRLLQRIVIQPLSKLTTHTIEIGKTEDTTVKVAMERDDELGLLSKEFDAMMDKLAKSREQVVKTARLAGMSEIATGVLHNVGNVLNSVNVSANVVKRKAEQLSVADLKSMTEVLEARRDDLGHFVTNDPQGQQFLPFLGELTREMSQQRETILTELGALGKGVEHIIELVRSQQSYAGTVGVFEPANLPEQVDAALNMCKQAYGFTGDLDVVRDYEELPAVAVDKHKLMEILVNLIQNARQVLDDYGVEEKRLTLRVCRVDDTARITVEDNGPGISEENLAKIFNHGFTTRKDGHGFGLHISANAATEMKSQLWAESEGLGKGARFILSIPMEAASVKQAA